MTIRRRTLTATNTYTGEVVTRSTEADYRWVATNGRHSTWHMTKEAAWRSARPKGWYVIPVDARHPDYV